MDGSISLPRQRPSPRVKQSPTPAEAQSRSARSSDRQSSGRTSERDANELELLVTSLHHPLLNLAETGDVELLLRLRLERAELARDQRIPVCTVGHADGTAHAEDVGLVERLARRVVLLPVAISGPRMGGHDDPGLG